jgi:hypothetical protein
MRHEKLATSIDFGTKLCDALGLDKNTIREIHIHIIAGELITLDVRQNLTENQGENLVKLFEPFYLTLKENEPSKTD